MFERYRIAPNFHSQRVLPFKVIFCDSSSFCDFGTIKPFTVSKLA